MKTAIVILNYNGKDLLAKYLPSMLQYSSDAELWVVDNASNDASCAYIINNFPTVKFIKLEENLGYSGGYNASVEKIDADLICFVNNDVGVEREWIPHIQQHFAQHPEVGIVQPKILSDVHKGYFDYAGAAGGLLDFMGLPYCRGRVLNYCAKDYGQYNDLTSVQWAGGAAFCIRKELFKDLGGFDEGFFMHFEEIDLSLRALAKGWQIHCVGTSVVNHLGGGSLATDDPKKLFFNIRNSMLTYTKILPIHIFPLWLLSRLAFDFFLGVYFLISGRLRHVLAIVRGHHSFFYHFSSYWKKRNTFFVPFKKTSVFIEYIKQKINPKYDIR